MPAKVAAKSVTPTAQVPAPLERYLRESRRPLASLAFVVPLLVLYEGGVVILGEQAVRNGGGTKEMVQDAVRIAAVINGVATAMPPA